MRVAFFEVETWEKNYLEKELTGVKKEFYKKTLNKRNLEKVKDCDIISIFIYSRIDKRILGSLPKLKAIITRSTGYDHIDIEECKKRGIKVANIQTYGDNTVAEHTFSLILALTRKLMPSVERAKKHDYTLKGLRGFDLKNRVIGIIGCGRIGINVARMARGFQMEVLVCDVNKDEKLAKRIGFEYGNFDKVLKEADIISLHLPYNEKTRHIITDSAIKKMKEGVIIINTARGGLINTDHLIKWLKKGKIRGAGLDVLESEMLVKEESQLLSGKHELTDLSHVIENNMLLNMDNVIITPHNAFNSEESVMRILNSTIACIKHPNDEKRCNYIVK